MPKATLAKGKWEFLVAQLKEKPVESTEKPTLERSISEAIIIVKATNDSNKESLSYCGVELRSPMIDSPKTTNNASKSR